MKMSPLLLIVVFAVTACIGTPSLAVELPPELPLWTTPPTEHSLHSDAKEQVRAPQPPSGSPSGSNRVFSFVSAPTYSIHRPDNPNGVGLVICPGGGYRDVWLDREGHDLAIWLKAHGVTSLVLKYRTNSGEGESRQYKWEDYLPAVEADAAQAIRILRTDAADLGVSPNKIGISGFSAGGNLALLSMLHTEPKSTETTVSGMPDFAGLFYPWFRDEGYQEIIRRRSSPASATRDICPAFIMNATDDRVTPADKCVDFYLHLLKARVKTELHVFGKGNHGFDLGTGRGESASLWPNSFLAWLHDVGMIEE